MRRGPNEAEPYRDTSSRPRDNPAFGAWLEPEEAVARLGWLETERPPEMEEYVCDECDRQCRAQLAGAGGG